MPASQATIGYGTIVDIENDATPAVYEKIAETKDVTMPEASVDQVEVTHNESPDRAKEYTPGLIDYGDASFEMNYISGSPADLRLQALLNTGVKRNVRVTSPNGSVMIFLAYVSGYSRRSPVGDARTATVNLKVSGPPSITAVV